MPRRLIDPKPVPRIRDALLLRNLHFEWRECVVCGDVGRLSLHHVCKHPRDDVRANLVMVCGDGVQGCHGRIEAHDPIVCRLLGEHIRDHRPDIIEHLTWRMGNDSVREWLRRNLWLDS